MSYSLFPDPASLQSFLHQHWQRQPLLVRGAVDPSRLGFPAEELAGMACEEGIESRLIQQRGAHDWRLQHGPFNESDFAVLPDSHWTLLVQDVDKYVPEVADLLELFGFLPDWRIDDIMLSYATDQGGVGPHTDSYDVFLVQAQGRRRWRISQREYQDTDLLPDCPLRVLQQFDTRHEWLLEPGDVLYLPPQVAHWGIAEGECMTWSIGMRGPSDQELAQAWLAQCSRQPDYFSDNLAHKASATIIDDTELATARHLIAATRPADDASFRHWFGCYVTEPKADFEIEAPAHRLDATDLEHALRSGQVLHRHPWARFAGIRLEPGRLALCSQGECHELPVANAALLDLVCADRHLDWARLHPHLQDASLLIWLGGLYNRGLLIFDE